MKKLLPILTLIALLAACQQPEFFSVEGKGYRFDDLKGKHLIVNYWATWCGPCIKEIPELNELALKHEDILAVWGVNFDEPQGDEMARQVLKMKIDFPVFQTNPSQHLGVKTPEVLPTTLIFDPQGQLIAELVGPQTEASVLAAMQL